MTAVQICDQPVAVRGPAPRTVAAALASLYGDPRQWLRQWHWKAALTSSSCRSALFFCVNLTAGFAAARAAWLTELLLRAATSGFYGAVTERFSRVEPRWAATMTVSILLPVTSHTLELLVHWLRGTEALIPSITASALFTIVSTAFNLHLMRHGVLTVGSGAQPLLRDLRAVPALFCSFVAAFRWRGGRQVRSSSHLS